MALVTANRDILSRSAVARISRAMVARGPSDAIALAARTGTPIYAEEQVLAVAGKAAEDVADGEPESEELVDEFREFIEHVSPEDFG